MTGFEGPGTDELERLREENAALRARNEEIQRDRAKAVPSRAHGRWRWPVAVVLLVLFGVLTTGSVAAVWAQRTLLDTDNYVETVAPLASEPEIQRSVARTAVNALFTNVDVEAEARAALPPRADFLAPGIAQQTQTFAYDLALRGLDTPQFQTLWTEANRRAHERLLPVLEGGSNRPAVSTAGGTVTVDMSEVVAQVKSALSERGLTFVERIPDDVAGTDYVLFRSEGLAQLQSAVSALNTLAIALPLLALATLAGAVAAAPDRRKAAMWAGLVTVLAMVALGGVLAWTRSWYVGSADRLVLSSAGAAVFFDTVVRFLRNALRTVAVLGLAVAAGAAVAGPSRAAVALRSSVTHGLGSVGEAVDLGGFSRWVERHHRGLDGLVAAIAAAVLLVSDAPTPQLVLWLALAVVAGIAVIEFLARAHGPGAGPGRVAPTA